LRGEGRCLVRERAESLDVAGPCDGARSRAPHVLEVDAVAGVEDAIDDACRVGERLLGRVEEGPLGLIRRRNPELLAGGSPLPEVATDPGARLVDVEGRAHRRIRVAVRLAVTECAVNRTLLDRAVP